MKTCYVLFEYQIQLIHDFLYLYTELDNLYKKMKTLNKRKSKHIQVVLKRDIVLLCLPHLSTCPVNAMLPSVVCRCTQANSTHNTSQTFILLHETIDSLADSCNIFIGTLMRLRKPIVSLQRPFLSQSLHGYLPW